MYMLPSFQLKYTLSWFRRQQPYHSSLLLTQPRDDNGKHQANSKRYSHDNKVSFSVITERFTIIEIIYLSDRYRSRHS